MSLHTTFKIGGNARLVVYPQNEEQISELVKCAKAENVRLIAVGNGSNLLVDDDGIDACVLILGEPFSQIKLIDDETIYAKAGAKLIALCRFLEYDDLKLSYRHSAYYDNGAVITGLYLKLKKGEKSEIKEKMDDLIGRRRAKQPLEYPSAGSTFKRPEGYFAGALIEQCNLKGKSVGGAQVSEKHAGFVINKGGATCKDVLDLCKYCSDKVMEETGVKLEMEIRVTK